MEGDGEDKGSELVSRSQQQKGKRGQEQWFSLCRKCGVQDAESARRRDGVLPGIHCEVKHRDSINVAESHRQAVQDSEGTGLIPMVAWRKTNQRRWIVTMALADLMGMLTVKNENIGHILVSMDGVEWLERVYANSCGDRGVMR